jgi:hypothetical protein
LKLGVFAGVAAALGIAIGMGTPNVARAAVVDLVYDLDLNGMTSGTCPNGICGTVTVTGDTTTSLTYVVNLSTGVEFHAQHNGNSGTGDALFFQLTDVGGVATIHFNPNPPGTAPHGTGYTYILPTTSGGPFAPSSGNFPGTYNYDLQCTNSTSGKVCPSSGASEVSFTVFANGGTLAIGAPNGHGDFVNDAVAFVAQLSVSGSCGSETCKAGTGLVGSGAPHPAPPPVPEPSTWAMMLIGFAGLAYAGYRKAKSARTAVSVA